MSRKTCERVPAIPKYMIIHPIKTLNGQVALPGDKSISHRAAMFTAISEGTSVIENFSTSEDCWSTVRCMRELGVRIEAERNTLTVHGAGKQGLRKPSGPLDCGNSGTTMRLLAGILAGQTFTATLTGDASLMSRPMGRIIEPLGLMGCTVDSTNGRAPISISGDRRLNPIVYELPVASAQIKSCVLLAGLNAEGTTEVIESLPTRDHTERMLRGLGVEVVSEIRDAGRFISVNGSARPIGRNISVPADVSSAAFFMVAAACVDGARIEMLNVGLNPSRVAVIDVLRTAGVSIEFANERDVNNEPAADIIVQGTGRFPSRLTMIRGDIIPNLIDEIPTLAVLGTQLPGGLEIRDAGELRVKESDRISAVATNLAAMGAEVEEFSDGLRIARSHLRGAEIDSFGDHRIAMAFSVAGLLAAGPTVIKGAEAADVSFPGFYEALDSVSVR